MLFMNQDKKNAWPSGLSLTLVGIQFVLIGVIAFTKPLWPPDWRLRGDTGSLRRGRIMGAPGYGIATSEGLPGSRAPRIIDCPWPLPLGSGELSISVGESAGQKAF
jgi:hypothetical protein